jgi:hypothetical protein
MSDIVTDLRSVSCFYCAGGLEERAANEIDRLRADLAQRTAERDAANARLALSMEAHQITISGTVASLLHTNTLTREAAGCKDGEDLIAVVRGLRAERDEARREICKRDARENWIVGESPEGVVINTPEREARLRGWNCFDAKEAKP